MAPDPESEALLSLMQKQRLAQKGGQAWRKLRFESGALGILPQEASALNWLIQHVKPGLILEVGTCGGGVALWLSTLCRGLSLGTMVHSADWGIDGKDAAGQVHFWSGDLRKPSGIWPGALMKHLPNPTLVLLRTQGGHEVTWSALRSLHKWLGSGAVICVESEPDSNPDSKPDDKRTSAHALWRFAARHPVEYGLLPGFEKHFGPDGLRTHLHCIRHTGLDPMDAKASPGLDAVRDLMAKENWRAALDDLNARKATRKPQRGVDYLRGLCFAALGETFSVCEAAKEELRYHPGHEHATALLTAMMRQLFPGMPKLGGEDFHSIYPVVRPYTMLSDERLYSIYLRTRLVCEMDVPGDIVECGVAAGGASALMAATVARHSKRPRKVFSCDTFEGMPTPTAKDMHGSTDAEASGWGSGTCAAPPGSLLEVAQKLGVADRVEPVKGLFCDTLPGLKDRLPDGIAFLHMDGDWYESTRDILISLYEKVQPKGFIQVDDYGHWEGCREAMHDYAREHGFEFKVNVIDSTGVWLQRPDRSPTDLMLLNLGCGAHFHTSWINLDIAPATKEVIAHDLASEPLPFDASTCCAVYHSHVLEHIPPAQVPGFIGECHRVLAPGGVLRIAVPDLEGIAREYLKQLDAGDHAKHEWMIIELVDQLTREQSGGEMLRYWKQNPMPAEDFVFQRVGWEARRFVEQWRSQAEQHESANHPTAEDIGRFRLGGEVHKWMYDRLSLQRLLMAAGFTAVNLRTATDSAIPGFAAFHLDADAEGLVRKPDSLFIEAIK
jgi:predicted SAM-dependent methyltransferase/cephalosporin hydroxylase